MSTQIPRANRSAVFLCAGLPRDGINGDVSTNRTPFVLMHLRLEDFCELENPNLPTNKHRLSAATAASITLDNAAQSFTAGLSKGRSKGGDLC
jgi:hypothetical protein